MQGDGLRLCRPLLARQLHLGQDQPWVDDKRHGFAFRDRHIGYGFCLSNGRVEEDGTFWKRQRVCAVTCFPLFELSVVLENQRCLFAPR
jgi:hypothetical protein